VVPEEENFEADISVDKISNVEGEVEVGDTVTYTITITNNGPDDATDVSVVDFLPEGVSLVSDSITEGGSYDGEKGAIEWSIDSLEDEEVLELMYSVTIDEDAEGELVNSVSVAIGTEAGDDPEEENDSDEEIIVVSDNDIETECDDGIDNDDDGNIDGADEDCQNEEPGEHSAVIDYPVGDDDEESGEITLLATYTDTDDDDGVQWAVRFGTCAANTNTVYGNVDGFNNDYEWDGHNFSSPFDTTEFEDGEYCFIFNPKEDAGQENLRATRTFVIANEEEQEPDPEPELCSVEDRVYPVMVDDSTQGPTNVGTAVKAARSNPEAALEGPNDEANEGTFFALGFGGELIVKFEEPVEGILSVWDATWSSYPMETADVSISSDGVLWTDIGEANNDEGNTNFIFENQFDIDGTAFQWVRVKDTTDSSLHTKTADAFDVDVVYVCGGPSDDDDNDGLTDEEEEKLGTDPNDPDTDGGGENDGSEVENDRNPLEDCDDNGATCEDEGNGSGGGDNDEEEDNNNGGGGVSADAFSGFSGGQVLGATTGPGTVLGASTCSPFLNSYIMNGLKENDSFEVMELQAFLSQYFGRLVRVTGNYDQETINAVNDFQEMHHSEVIAPWGIGASTGHAYLTTKRKLNMEYCLMRGVTLDIPMPELIPFSGQ